MVEKVLSSKRRIAFPARAIGDPAQVGGEVIERRAAPTNPGRVRRRRDEGRTPETAHLRDESAGDETRRGLMGKSKSPVRAD